ncbi:1529_t:CDS:2 [Paraglomus occultum]|uniref:1529_t:CDS:1 n=1 Tax=Paraglomus occultum TaxID=144539 RepID=A0A9N8WTH8_9GLOM|nr:1529_t:CDS:2 [Paraglomus occultum]
MKLSKFFVSPKKLRSKTNSNHNSSNTSPQLLTPHRFTSQFSTSPTTSASLTLPFFADNSSSKFFYSSPNSSNQSLNETKDDDDLDENIFYTVLRKDYSKIFHRVAVICVPHSRSIVGLKMSRSFIETHSLTPSPYFTGQYHSINGKIVSIERNVIKSISGFKEHRTVRILGEELVYNESYKSIQVLIIERPLEGEGMATESTSPTIPSERNYENDLLFLQSFPENENAIKELAHMVTEFNETYVYVRGYACYAVDRIMQILNKAVTAFLKANQTLANVCRLQHELDQFTELLENVIMAELHQKIFIDALCPIYNSHDSYLESIMYAYFRARLNLKDYGICDRLQNMPEESLYTACEILSCLDEDDTRENGLQYGLGISAAPRSKLVPAKTPLEKLICAKKAIQEVANVADTFLNQLTSGLSFDEGGERSSITTDDFIPLMAYVIVNTRIRKLGSVLFYMQTFRLSKTERSELSFALTTLRAATEYLKSDPLSLHDAVSIASSISSLASSHSSFKPTNSNRARSRSRSTSLSTPPTPVSTHGVPHSRSSSLTSGLPNTSRDKSPARSVNSVSSSSTQQNYKGGSATPNVHTPGYSLNRSLSQSEDLGQVDYSLTNSPLSSTPEEGHHALSRRTRRASVTPGLVIKPQILIVPSRTSPGRRSIDSDRTSLSDIVANDCAISKSTMTSSSLPMESAMAPLPVIRSPSRSSMTAQRTYHRNSVHVPEIIAVIPRSPPTSKTIKPALDLSPPSSEIMGDFLSSLQNIDGNVSGSPHGEIMQRW